MKTTTLQAILYMLCATTLYSQSDSKDSTPDKSGSSEATRYFSLNIDWTSQYIWRDFLFGYSAFQPSVNIIIPETPVSINHWLSFGYFNQDSSNPNNLYEVNGLDLQNTTTLSIEIKDSFVIGAIHYAQTLPDTTKSTFNGGELFFSFSPKLPLNPGVTVYVANTGDIYSIFSISEGLESQGWTIDLSSSLAFRPNSITSEKGLRDFSLEVGVLAPMANVQLGAFARGTTIIGDLTSFDELMLSRHDRTRLQVGIRLILN